MLNFQLQFMKETFFYSRPCVEAIARSFWLWGPNELKDTIMTNPQIHTVLEKNSLLRAGEVERGKEPQRTRMSAKKQKRAKKKNKNQSVLFLFGLCRPHRLWSGCQVSSEIALSLSINTPLQAVAVAWSSSHWNQLEFSCWLMRNGLDL